MDRLREEIEDALQIGDTKVFLGLVHEADVEGFPRRLELARRYLSDLVSRVSAGTAGSIQMSYRRC
ncbi:MAG: hypothetical protein ACRDQA_11770 [Nocardioidaceae bacterium]